jgi:poly(A) polymerase
MRLTFEPEHLALFKIIKAELHPDQTLHIVGGAVRDLLLGRDLHDLDFAMVENPTDLAKKLARRLQAGFFVLDDERHTARVVNYDQQGRLFPLDFVQYTGSSLDEDLYHRDFTINAMAVPIDNLSQVIDPLAGELDLQRGLLRACSEHALLDDPVRVLRGVRLAVQFNFDYAPGLEAAMQNAAAHLPNTSYERQRDEFFRLLAGPDPAKGLQDCRRFRVFETLLPPLVDLESIPAVPPHHLGLFEHTIQTVAHYHHLVNLLSTGWIDQSEKNWPTREVFSQLKQFSKELSFYFSTAVTPGRTKAELAYFGALLHDAGKPLTVKESLDGRFHYHNHAVVGAELAWQMAKRLQLSNAESDWVEKMVRHHMDLMALVNFGILPNQRKVYWYFKESGEVGVAIALLLLVDTLATFGDTLDHNQWNHTVSVVEILLSAWFNHHDTMINPVPLLNGFDLQQHYGMKPGKRIGTLLDHLVEEQASGNITSTDEAHTFVRQHLSQLGICDGE